MKATDGPICLYTRKRIINDDVTNSPCALVLKHSTTLDGIHGTTHHTSASGDEFSSLKDYVSRMKVREDFVACCITVEDV